MWTNWKRGLGLIGTALLLCSASQAEEICPVEVKLLLAPPTTQRVIESLGFDSETTGRVYFFDTGKLDLLRQGVMVRVRQGSDNDLTVKVRVPEGNKKADTNNLRRNFRCEIDKSGTGETTSYSVRRKYKFAQVPERGIDISTQFSPSQERVLRAARVSIDWTVVVRIANIKSTRWETSIEGFPNLSLELWEWPTGSILEISTKSGPGEGPSRYLELQRIVNTKNLTLNSRQGTKTSLVLETIAHRRTPN